MKSNEIAFYVDFVLCSFSRFNFSNSCLLGGVFSVCYVKDYVFCKQEKFYFFSDVNAFFFLANISSTVLPTNGKSGQPYLEPDLREKAFSIA